MQYTKYLLYLCGLLLVLSIVSCDEEETTTRPGDPSNLDLQILVYDNGSGIVLASATAVDVVEYRFDMGDGSDPVSQSSGDYEHTYARAGNYTIEVQAYGTSGRFLKDTKQVFVPGDNPIGVGEGYTTPISYPGMVLAWNDEFEGGRLNTDDWTFETGTGCPNLCGWGNNELQFYREDNTSMGDGVLTITADNIPHQSSSFTSSRIITRGKQAFRYGRIDVRAVLPQGQGMWPAIWMLGSSQPSVGWPACGEIDIMEMIGGRGRENTVGSNIYWSRNGSTQNAPRSFSLDEGFFYDQYHVFSLIWTEDKLEFLVDDESFYVVDISVPDKAAFREPFFFVMNIAVGGNWPGSPDETTRFPQTMQVDYIRVFQPQG